MVPIGGWHSGRWERFRREESMKQRWLSYLPGTPVAEASVSIGAVISLFRKTRTSRLLILGLLALAATLAGAQTVFNCASGFSSTPTATCGVGIPNVTSQGTFETYGTPSGYTPQMSGSSVELAIPTADQTALNLDWTNRLLMFKRLSRNTHSSLMGGISH